MRVNVTSEDVLLRDHSGEVWSLGGFGDDFWSRYLTVFDGVTVIARVRSVAAAPPGATRITSPLVKLLPVRDFVGCKGLATQAFPTAVTLVGACQLPGALIIRLPGPIGIGVGVARLLVRKPFAVEVVGDMDEVVKCGAIGSGVCVRTIGQLGSRLTRLLCRRACTASYVTQRALQLRYPPRDESKAASVPSIDLQVPTVRPTTVSDRRAGRDGVWQVFSAGTMNVRYKGFNILMDAIAQQPELRLQVRLRLAGSGRLRPELQRYAYRLGLGDKVTFLGQLDRRDMDRELDRCDLFVLASLTEGLPKVIIEAMAAGAPVVATAVGGVPELIEAEHLVPPGDAGRLAALMASCLRDCSRLQAMQLRNLKASDVYSGSHLREKRRRFYEQVLQEAEW